MIERDDRDPALAALFAEAGEDLDAGAFTSDTMARVDRLRRRAIVGWLSIGLILAAAALSLAGPLTDAVRLLSGILDLSLVPVGEEAAAILLAPLNSVAAVLALGFLVVFRLFRKIFA